MEPSAITDPRSNLEKARAGESPSLSVVIASVNGYRYIANCLRSLEHQRARDHAEVLVLEASGDGAAARIAREYPWATVVSVGEGLTIPQLRIPTP